MPMAGQCIGRHSANKSRKMTMEQTQVDGGRLGSGPIKPVADQLPI